MSDLQGTPGELRATISITRKASGKVETYELVGHVTAEQEQQLLENSAQTEKENEQWP